MGTTSASQRSWEGLFYQFPLSQSPQIWESSISSVFSAIFLIVRRAGLSRIRGLWYARKKITYKVCILGGNPPHLRTGSEKRFLTPSLSYRKVWREAVIVGEVRAWERGIAKLRLLRQLDKSFFPVSTPKGDSFVEKGSKPFFLYCHLNPDYKHEVIQSHLPPVELHLGWKFPCIRTIASNFQSMAPAANLTGGEVKRITLKIQRQPFQSCKGNITLERLSVTVAPGSPAIG